MPSRQFTVVAFDVDVTAVSSSTTPASKMTTPFASAVTTLLASEVPSVVMSLRFSSVASAVRSLIC